MTGLIVCLGVLAAASVYGIVHRRMNGRIRMPARDDRERLTAADLGGSLGVRATLVQFSSAFCAPCRATRQLLNDLAGAVDGVHHIEIDAETRLDLVRRLNVLKTPTVLVLDADGAVLRRAAGQPGRADLLAALVAIA